MARSRSRSGSAKRRRKEGEAGGAAARARSANSDDDAARAGAGAIRGGAARSPETQQKAKKKKDGKKLKKESKKEKKLQKKLKKAAKKAEKAARKADQAANKKAKKKKKKSSSSSSSSSSIDSDGGLNFVLDQDFGSAGKHLDPQNPEVKIQRALGLGCGSFAFIGRDDDEATAKEVGYEQGGADAKKGASEDRSRDWICSRSKANGEACNARNFLKNENCYSCGALRPASINVRQSRDVKASKLDGFRYR